MSDQESSAGSALKTMTVVGLAGLAILGIGYLTHMMSDRSITMFDVQQCYNACERNESQMKLVTRYSCECMSKNDTKKWTQTHREIEWVTPKISSPVK